MTRILLIEDEEPIRRVLIRILSEESASYEIIQAEDGREGISKLSKSIFDLVLCDIKMPKMDGIEVLQAAKKNGIHVPFIMLTGHGNIETAVEEIKKNSRRLAKRQITWFKRDKQISWFKINKENEIIKFILES